MLHPASVWSSFQMRRLGRFVGKPVRFREYPQQVLESEPQVIPCRPALFNPDHLSRVTHCAFGRTVAELVQVLSERSYTEGPLSTYHMGEATVLGGMIFGKGQSFFLSDRVKTGWQDILASAEMENETVLANSTQGLMYFGHWLSDDVSAFEAFRDHPGLVSLPLPAWTDVGPYSQLFGQEWIQRKIIRTRSLTLVRDLGFSRRKAARYRVLRDRLRRGFMPQDNKGKVVFLQRGPSGKPREIVNLPQLLQRLSDAGVLVVTAEGDGKKLVGSLLDASVIITIEGSQDRHCIYSLRDGGGMLTLLPPDRFYVATHEWARNLDMHSGAVIGTPVEGGFTIDPDEVLQMVDRLLHLTENREAG